MGSRTIVARVLLLLCLLHSAAESSSQERVALVIGNSRYHEKPLRNPVNDANDITHALRSLGFEVEIRLNASQETMEAAVRDFGEKLQGHSVGLFYFSGHGIQYEGNNYLIPIGAIPSISTPGHLRYKTMAAGYVLGVMEQAGNPMNILILDACRNSPFKGLSRNLDRGLGRMHGVEGTIIAYATSPGKIALDGIGRNSPYTEQLIESMNQPNLPVELMLKRVRSGVKARTSGKQTPWYEASIDGEFIFRRSGSAEAEEVAVTWDAESRVSEQTKPVETGYYLVSRTGLGDIRFGSAPDVAMARLGKPNRIESYGQYIYENVSFLYCFNRLSTIFVESTFPAVTDKGVKLGDSVEKVLRLYGEPEKRFPPEEGSWVGWLSYTQKHRILFDYKHGIVDGFDLNDLSQCDDGR